MLSEAGKPPTCSFMIPSDRGAVALYFAFAILYLYLPIATQNKSMQCFHSSNLITDMTDTGYFKQDVWLPSRFHRGRRVGVLLYLGRIQDRQRDAHRGYPRSPSGGAENPFACAEPRTTAARE